MSLQPNVTVDPSHTAVLEALRAHLRLGSSVQGVVSGFGDYKAEVASANLIDALALASISSGTGEPSQSPVVEVRKATCVANILLE